MRNFDYNFLSNQLYTKEIVDLLSELHEFRGKQELYLEAFPDVLEAMTRVAKIQSTEASNRIEGIFTSNRRLQQLMEENTEPSNRDEEEIAGYREVLNVIHESYEFISIRPSFILQLHRDLYLFNTGFRGGEYKNVDNVIEEVDAFGNRSVRFQPVPAFQTKDAMDAMCSSFLDTRNKNKLDPLLLISMFVLDFLCIHPFTDGNGRMSRLLTLLLLYQDNYIVGKYISIEMMIEKSKEAYYYTLQKSSVGWHENKNDYRPFVRYLLSTILAAYKEFSSRVDLLRDKGLTKAERVKVTFQRHHGKISKSDIATWNPDISLVMIEKTLASLVKEGYIRKVGGGRSTAYVLNDQD